MNSCVLMAKIISTPQLRYTQDGQRSFTEVLVEFAPLRPEEAPATLRVIGWGNLATEMVENYSEGNWVILEGRLSMIRFDRQEGFKETRAQLTISHIYRVDGQVVATVPASNVAKTPAVAATATAARDNVVAMNPFKSKPPQLDTFEPEIEPPFSPPPVQQPSRQPVSVPDESSDDQDLDEIPFMRPTHLSISEIDLQDGWELEANRPGNWLHGTTDLWR
ncbi:single-strand binding protein/Primosomal replication protein n [Gloeothece citriformis PCC 7424]|uniref:Single-strand binding protein/Primosomal replication protein n n=1 Tax=Gloeothece citriformis (strain PCC 7424) TaxID=65393 RepID=B7KDG9_GLOC7|nr:single-stranded DNA-binding protein [Gloeothece citriformis]ACK68989.1 single-strand binding protein/Primosomal replication protein n [Gloeothece citriformis PCC 7424]